MGNLCCRQCGVQHNIHSTQSTYVPQNEKLHYVFAKATGCCKLDILSASLAQ